MREALLALLGGWCCPYSAHTLAPTSACLQALEQLLQLGLLHVGTQVGQDGARVALHRLKGAGVCSEVLGREAGASEQQGPVCFTASKVLASAERGQGGEEGHPEQQGPVCFTASKVLASERDRGGTGGNLSNEGRVGQDGVAPRCLKPCWKLWESRVGWGGGGWGGGAGAAGWPGRRLAEPQPRSEQQNT